MRILLSNIFGVIFNFCLSLEGIQKNKCNTTNIEETCCLLIRNKIDNIKSLSHAFKLTLILR